LKNILIKEQLFIINGLYPGAPKYVFDAFFAQIQPSDGAIAVSHGCFAGDVDAVNCRINAMQ
jgi:hypothetical protein